MKKEQFICDECGAERKEVNHWYRIVVTSDIFPGIEIVPLMTDAKNTAGRHVCGQACALKAIDRWFSEVRAKKAGE